MSSTRRLLALCVVGIAAVYVFTEWVVPWWDTPTTTTTDDDDDDQPSVPAPSLALHPDAMASSASLHTLSSDGDGDDTDPLADVLSPPPTHVVSRRKSFRNHDVFAASHISFSELGSLVAPGEHDSTP